MLNGVREKGVLVDGRRLLFDYRYLYIIVCYYIYNDMIVVSSFVCFLILVFILAVESPTMLQD
jgi:hypothetical protein